jgi:hypothetical protein
MEEVMNKVPSHVFSIVAVAFLFCSNAIATPHANFDLDSKALSDVKEYGIFLDIPAVEHPDKTLGELGISDKFSFNIYCDYYNEKTNEYEHHWAENCPATAQMMYQTTVLNSFLEIGLAEIRRQRDVFELIIGNAEDAEEIIQTYIDVSWTINNRDTNLTDNAGGWSSEDSRTYEVGEQEFFDPITNPGGIEISLTRVALQSVYEFRQDAIETYLKTPDYERAHSKEQVLSGSLFSQVWLSWHEATHAWQWSKNPIGHAMNYPLPGYAPRYGKTSEKAIAWQKENWPDEPAFVDGIANPTIMRWEEEKRLAEIQTNGFDYLFTLANQDARLAYKFAEGEHQRKNPDSFGPNTELNLLGCSNREERFYPYLEDCLEYARTGKLQGGVDLVYNGPITLMKAPIRLVALNKEMEAGTISVTDGYAKYQDIVSVWDKYMGGDEHTMILMRELIPIDEIADRYRRECNIFDRMRTKLLMRGKDTSLSSAYPH